MNANVHRTSDPLHRDPDHTIDRALSALRDAAPRPGLEGRILTSLEHRATTPQRTRFHISAHLALWTAASAAVLAVASLLILHRRATPTEFARSTQSGLAAGFSPLNSRSTNNGALAPAQPAPNTVILSEASQSHREAQSKDPDTAHRATNSEPFSTTNLAQTTQAVSSRPEPGAPPSTRTGVPGELARWGGKRQGGVGTIVHEPPSESATNATTPTDDQALADLHAPSHPAPPLPLTAQEKLFLRMLRDANATQIAELNPAFRERQDAAETAAFKAFFPDPPHIHQPGDDE